MGGILFKIFVYYMLYKSTMALLGWLYMTAIPGLISFIVETVGTLMEPPTPQELARREREAAKRRADITTAEGRLADAQRRAASIAEFNAKRWERAGL